MGLLDHFFRLCGCLLSAAILFNAQPVSAQSAADLRGPVTVELLSGRQFTATVDPRTNDELLWLRWSEGSAQLLRPLRWEQIHRAHLGQVEVDGRQLRQLVKASRPEILPVFRRPTSRRIVMRGPGGAGDGERPSRTTTELSAGTSGDTTTRPSAGPRVRSLAIDTRVANWDADVEVDGLIVDVYPLDAAGRTVPVFGTLEVELIVDRGDTVTRPQSLVRRGRWTERVRVGDFGSGGARFKLPFGSAGFHPEFDRRTAPYGAVVARLNVPGQGVFSATDSDVRIRPYSAVRDVLESASGTRFFPLEKTGRGRR